MIDVTSSCVFTDTFSYFDWLNKFVFDLVFKVLGIVYLDHHSHQSEC